MKNFNSGAGRGKRRTRENALIYIMYMRGAGQSNRQIAQKVNQFLYKV